MAVVNVCSRAIVTSICSMPPYNRPLATCTTRMRGRGWWDVGSTRWVWALDRLPEPGHDFDRVARQDRVVRLDVLDDDLLGVDEPGDSDAIPRALLGHAPCHRDSFRDGHCRVVQKRPAVLDVAGDEEGLGFWNEDRVAVRQD